ncbi:hypothetical protein [Streptomyces sp. NPDC101115]|uniref:hypothetical protein n=1 Tax=Streptomyces sp. NPDC101115 TaxID=3366106 RepID=UPI0037FD10EA
MFVERRVSRTMRAEGVPLPVVDRSPSPDWLMSTDLNAVPITHPARKQALADLLARLEEVDVVESTEEEIAAAQEEVAKDMGW